MSLENPQSYFLHIPTLAIHAPSQRAPLCSGLTNNQNLLLNEKCLPANRCPVQLSCADKELSISVTILCLHFKDQPFSLLELTLSCFLAPGEEMNANPQLEPALCPKSPSRNKGLQPGAAASPAGHCSGTQPQLSPRTRGKGVKAAERKGPEVTSHRELAQQGW